jgi:hypothetical protein
MSDAGEPSLQDQLVRAARDLWSTVVESGADFIVFTDRRRLSTRVQRTANGTYQVSWEPEGGDVWTVYEREFENLREAAFHGFQGPH